MAAVRVSELQFEQIIEIGFRQMKLSGTIGRSKRIIRNMQRISQRTALTVIFGIAGRMDVPKKNAIIGFCRRNLLKRKRRLGAVRDALMEDILLASGTACRRFCWK